MLPAELEALRSYSRVSAAVSGHFLPELESISATLRTALPDYALGTPCNAAVVARLCSLMCWLSVTLFLPEPATETKRGRWVHWASRRAAFVALVKEFYPWEATANPEEHSQLLYDVVRPAFAQVLPHGGVARLLMRRVAGDEVVHGIATAELNEVAQAPSRPYWLPATLERSENAWAVSVDGLFRDVYQLLVRLSQDRRQMAMAEERLANGVLCWRDETPGRLGQR